MEFKDIVGVDSGYMQIVTKAARSILEDNIATNIRATELNMPSKQYLSCPSNESDSFKIPRIAGHEFRSQPIFF